jgi:hypothetical protein
MPCSSGKKKGRMKKAQELLRTLKPITAEEQRRLDEISRRAPVVGNGYGNGDGYGASDPLAAARPRVAMENDENDDGNDALFSLANNAFNDALNDSLRRLLAIYLFEQDVMDEAKKIAERPEEYAQVLAIMWTETKLDLRAQYEKMALETLEGIARLQRLDFDRVDEFADVRSFDRRTLRARHGVD